MRGSDNYVTSARAFIKTYRRGSFVTGLSADRQTKLLSICHVIMCYIIIDQTRVTKQLR